MKFIFTLLLVLLPILAAEAQPEDEWVRFYRPPWPSPHNIGWFNDVVFTAEGGFAMTGIGKDSTGRGIMWLVVADEEGFVIQQSFHPQDLGHPQAEAFSLIQDEEGGYVMGGRCIDHENEDQQAMDFAIVRTDADGEFLWLNYPFLGMGGGECYAVIELKGGDFLACGLGPTAVVFNTEGDEIWSRSYREEIGGGAFRSVREIEGGAVFAGFTFGDTTRPSMIKIDEEGNVVDHFTYGIGVFYGMTSCDAGFIASGNTYGRRMIGVLVDEDLNQIWRSEYDMRQGSLCVTSIPNRGFIFCGSNSRGFHLICLNGGGNFMWEENHRFEERLQDHWSSVITNERGNTFAAGWSGSGGILLKTRPYAIPSDIAGWFPHELDLTVLCGDSVRFSVTATNLENDSLHYNWMFEGDTISTNPLSDSLMTVQFPELGTFSVKFTVTGGEDPDSVTWHVDVANFFIESFAPDEQELNLQRGTTVDFEITTRTNEPDSILYLWSLVNTLTNEELQVSDSTNLAYTFNTSAMYILEAAAQQGETSDAILWNINISSGVLEYFPDTLEFNVVEGDSVVFEITPSNWELDSLEYHWFLNGRGIGNRNSCEIIFNNPDVVRVVILLTDPNGFDDSVRWTVTVEPLSSIQVSAPIVTEFMLFNPHPNPFNSTTTVTYTLPAAAQVSLKLYDLSGREILTLIEGIRQVGVHTTMLNGTNLPSGLYLLRLESAEQTFTQKVMLIK